jgi:diaphanous 1
LRASGTAPSSSLLPKKPNKKPESGVKLKGFFWSKLPDKNAALSKWKDLPDTGINLDLPGLESVFSSAATKAGTTASVGTTTKSGPTLLFDGKRQQNGGIALARLRLTNDEARARLLEVESLTTDQVSMFLALLPTAEEIEQVSGFDGDPSSLGNLEQFVLAIKDVPFLKERLDAAQFRLRFREMAADVQAQLKRIEGAVDIVDRCQEVQALLRFVLAIGNHLNGGTPRGGAYGFKLDALGKLKEVKSSNNKLTLLDYVAEAATDPKSGLRPYGIFRVPERLDGVAAAKDCSLQEALNDVKRLRAGFELISRTVARADKASGGGDEEEEEEEDGSASAAGGDRLSSVFHKFLADNEPAMTSLEDASEQLHRRFTDLLSGFAEDEKQDTIAFFSLWASFAKELGSALDKVERQRELEAKATKSKTSTTSARATTSPVKSKEAPSSPGISSVSMAKNLSAEIMARRRKKEQEEEEDTSESTGRTRRRSILQSAQWRKGRKSIGGGTAGPNLGALAAAAATRRALGPPKE